MRSKVLGENYAKDGFDNKKEFTAYNISRIRYSDDRAKLRIQMAKKCCQRFKRGRKELRWFQQMSDYQRNQNIDEIRCNFKRLQIL